MAKRTVLTKAQRAELRKKIKAQPKIEFAVEARDASGRKVSQKAGQGTRAIGDRRATIEARMRVHGLKKDLAEMPEAGSVLGRMCLARHISPLEVRAGECYAADVAAFAWSRGIPMPAPRVADWNATHGRGDGPNVDPATYAAIGEDYEAAYGALAAAGRAALVAVNDAAVRDHDARPLDVQAGLSTLVRHYNITE